MFVAVGTHVNTYWIHFRVVARVGGVNRFEHFQRFLVIVSGQQKLWALR